MEKGKYFTLRVTEKVKNLYKLVEYRKGEVIKNFREKYKERYKEFSSVYDTIKDVPPSLTGYKFSVTAPKEIKDREEFKAFLGYLIVKLVENNGSLKKAVKSVKEDLSGI